MVAARTPEAKHSTSPFFLVGRFVGLQGALGRRLGQPCAPLDDARARSARIAAGRASRAFTARQGPRPRPPRHGKRAVLRAPPEGGVPQCRVFCLRAKGGPSCVSSLSGRTSSKSVARSKLSALAVQINRAHGNAEQALRRGLEHAIKAGELLTEAKAAVAHGEWLKWLSENCPQIPERTSSFYMRACEDAARRRASSRHVRRQLRELRMRRAPRRRRPEKRRASRCCCPLRALRGPSFAQPMGNGNVRDALRAQWALRALGTARSGLGRCPLSQGLRCRF
jgi:hypothetical protein